MSNQDLSKFWSRIIFRLGIQISVFPTIYYPLRQITGRADHRSVQHDTEIVLEGYPRSANSTTRIAFDQRQPGQIKIAHHLHHAAQVLRGVSWKIPTVVLIRYPKDAVLSYLALAREDVARNGPGARSKVNDLEIEDALYYWIKYYSAILPVIGDIVIAPFHLLIDDVGPMIRAVNAKFGTTFNPNIAEDVAEKKRYHIKFHAKPNDMRDAIISDLRSQFNNKLESSMRFREMATEADRIYEIFISHQALHGKDWGLDVSPISGANSDHPDARFK